jgi:hypothetical protein
MRLSPLAAVAVAVVQPVPFLPGIATKALPWLAGAAGMAAMALAWRVFVRPALDTFILASHVRRSAEFRELLRTTVLRADYAERVQWGSDVRAALEAAQRADLVSRANAEQLSSMSAQIGQCNASIGTVAALVRDVSDQVGDMRRSLPDTVKMSLHDALLHGQYGPPSPRPTGQD